MFVFAGPLCTPRRAVRSPQWLFLFSALHWLALDQGSLTNHAFAAEPLHVQINAAVDRAAVGPYADTVDDLTFLRRVYLDFTGRIPSVTVARNFVADTAPDKRARLVDRLLESADFARQMAVAFDVMLMERRGGKHVKTAEVRAWLQKFFADDRPWPELVHDFLSADGTEGEGRVPAAFILERDVEPNLLTREVGRMFLGVDLQCAQCHDHPLIEDYHQSDYHGLFAFVSQSKLHRPDAKKPGQIAEVVKGQAQFKSVFTDREAVTLPRLPGEVEVVEPTFAVGDEYSIRPAKNVRPVPKYSRRGKLAELLSSGQNPLFRRNIVNRLWALMMGRGLVHPVDHHHSDNPASNPELLNLLAEEFASSNYSVKSLLRGIALSDVYQRSSELPGKLAEPLETSQQEIARLRNVVKAANAEAFKAEDAGFGAFDELTAALEEAKPLRVELGKALTAAEAAAKKRDETATTVSTNRIKFETTQTVATTLRTAADAAKSALSSIPDDQELTAALKTIDAKATREEAESNKLKANLDASIKAAADAAQKLAEANQAVEPHRKKLAPIEEKIRQRRAKHTQLRNTMSRNQEIAEYARQRIDFLQTLERLAAAERTIESARTELAKLRPKSAKTRADFATAETQERSLAARLSVLKDKHSSSQATLAATIEQLSGRQQAITLSSDALSAARSSLSVLDSLKESSAVADSDLSSAVAILDSTQKRLAGELAGLQQQADTLTKSVEEIQAELTTVTAAYEQAAASAASAKKALAEMLARISKLESDSEQAQATVTESSDQVIKASSARFNVAVLEPLSPEQLGWSILQATGYVDRQHAAELAKLNKEKPLTEEEQKDNAKLAERNRQADEATYNSLSKSVERFVSLFAGQKGQPQDAFFSTVDQALFFANGNEIRSWLRPSGTNLTARLSKLDDANAVAEEVYLAVLTRLPTTEEAADVAEYLEQRKDERPAAIDEIAWALLTSAEFRFHH